MRNVQALEASLHLTSGDAIVNQVKRIGTLIIVCLLPLNSLAAPLSFPLDIKHASIKFSINYLWLSKITGHFKDFSGTFTINDENITNCTFGGKNLQTLFITTARWGMSKEDIEKNSQAGGLYSIDLSIKGMPDNSFKG